MHSQPSGPVSSSFKGLERVGQKVAGGHNLEAVLERKLLHVLDRRVALVRYAAAGVLQSHIATLSLHAHKRCIRETRLLLLANRTGDGSATLFAKDKCYHTYLVKCDNTWPPELWNFSVITK
eukprot:COSAG02_NODE_33675_length_496_cov_1.254408_1_plen_121_part_10